MFAWLTLHVAALVAVGTLFGGMTFFAFLFTPLAFKFMGRQAAGDFLRRLFPVYHRVMAGAAILPALLLMPGRSYGVEVVSMLVIAALFLIAARVLVPAAEAARQAGDQARFARVHRASVIVHSVQWLIALVIFIRLAQ